jgi:hypothetical protein
MHLIGRHDHIRCWQTWTNRLSPPFALDRGRAQDSPTIRPLLKHPEWQRYTQWSWERLKRHTLDLLLDEAAVVGFRDYSGVKMWFGAPTGTPGIVARSLGASYTAGSAGNAVGARIFSGAAKTLSYCYAFLSSYSGTAASVTSIIFEARAEAGGGTLLPDTTTALGSSTTSLSSQLGWIKGPTFTASLTASTVYWLICGGNTGATNFPNVAVGGSNAYETEPGNFGTSSAHRTADGWQTKTVESRISRVIGCFSDGTAVGDPFTADATPTNDSNDKGLYLGGLSEQLAIVGMGSDVNMASATGMKIYAAATTAGGTALASGTTIANHSGASARQGFFLSAPYTIPKSTALRLVFYGAGNFNSPRVKQIGTIGIGSATDLQGAFPLGGASYSTVWNGSAWVDTQSSFPMLYVWILDQVTVSIPPAAGFLATPGMRGGFNG